jgi:hypothetical protein
MAANELYELLTQAIDGFVEECDELSSFELVGVLRLISAEIEAGAIAAAAEEDEGEEPED